MHCTHWLWHVFSTYIKSLVIYNFNSQLCLHKQLAVLETVYLPSPRSLAVNCTYLLNLNKLTKYWLFIYIYVCIGIKFLYSSNFSWVPQKKKRNLYLISLC